MLDAAKQYDRSSPGAHQIQKQDGSQKNKRKKKYTSFFFFVVSNFFSLSLSLYYLRGPYPFQLGGNINVKNGQENKTQILYTSQRIALHTTR